MQRIKAEHNITECKQTESRREKCAQAQVLLTSDPEAKLPGTAFSVFSVSLFKTFLFFLETPRFLLLAAVAWGRACLLSALWPECVPFPLLTVFIRKETSVKRSASD